jgi:RNA polymerase sigma-70 factor, ECF subfamily
VSESDAEYVRLCLGERPDMFRHLVCRHEASLVAFLLSRLGNRGEAVEAAQEALVRAYFALPKLKKPEAFSSWLLGIADRVAMESRRKKQRASRRREEVVLDRFESSPASNREPDGQLGRAVADLPEAHRQVILLRFYGNQSCAEISRELGVSRGTVTSRLSRAYSLLRAALQADDWDLEAES